MNLGQGPHAKSLLSGDQKEQKGERKRSHVLDAVPVIESHSIPTAYLGSSRYNPFATAVLQRRGPWTASTCGVAAAAAATHPPARSHTHAHNAHIYP